MAIQIPYTDGFITPEGGNNFESKNNKGQVNGYAPLDANAKVPAVNLPDTVVSSGGALGAGGTINLSNRGGSINTSNDGGSINTTGIDGNVGGSINTSGTGEGDGGSINTSNSGGSINTMGGDAGSGGSINTSAGDSDGGGSINTSGGEGGVGGSINTSNGGGSINTRGVGSIQLGVSGTRTTLNGSASGTDKTITLPNATGTIALTSDVRFTFRTLFATTSVANASDTRYFSTIDAVGAVSGLELRNFQLPYLCKIVACSSTIYNTSGITLASGGTVAYNLVAKAAVASTSSNQIYGLLNNWTLAIAGVGMTSNYSILASPITISAGTNLASQVVFTNLAGASLRGELTLYIVPTL